MRRPASAITPIRQRVTSKIATVGEDYSFVYTQIFGLVLEFCGDGGQVTNRQWVPLGTKDFASIIAALPDDVDAIYLGPGRRRRPQLPEPVPAGRRQGQLIGGSIMVDQTILSAKGSAKNALIGTIAASAMATPGTIRAGRSSSRLYQNAFPRRQALPEPGAARHQLLRRDDGACIEALNKINGDLGPNQENFKKALASLEIDAPNGQIKLDSNRQAIGTNFVTEVVEDGKGGLVSKVVEGRAERQPDARLRSRRVRQDRPAEPQPCPECKKY